MAAPYDYYYSRGSIFFILLVLSSHFALAVQVKVETGNGGNAKCSVVSVDCRTNQDCVPHCASVGPRQTAECFAFVLARPWKICRCCPV